MNHRRSCWSLFAVLVVLSEPRFEPPRVHAAEEVLTGERLAGEGVWVDPRVERVPARIARIRVTVWFEEQFLGTGESWDKRAKEFKNQRRRELRDRVMRSLKDISNRSWETAGEVVKQLEDDGVLRDVERHWIINGFSGTVGRDDVAKLNGIPGLRKMFLAGAGAAARRRVAAAAPIPDAPEAASFEADRYQHPWYIRHLQADRVWKELGVTGAGTLNVIHDFNFVLTDNVTPALYRNPDEVAGNGKDDDGNGLIDDVYGFDFDSGSARLTRIPVPAGGFRPQAMHGFMCAAIISGRGNGEKKYEFGIAPRSQWAGVIAGQHLEAAVEWAIEQKADTYSMSFSRPGLGDYRSHWRKVMEHGAFCGVCFVSGAGNFAQQVPVPVQMRTPEDIPEAVFAAAGVQRDFSRTPFSSQGPVEWQTEHYQDGRVQKPEVCAFNMGLPLLMPDGSVRPNGVNGNSFAGPMFCGSLALMLSADPDLLPWDLKEIITSTATDVGPEGIDPQTGHGLINCYRAVREVLRRKAIREGKDATPWTGREDGDELDVAALAEKLKPTRLTVQQLQRTGQARKVGFRPGDVVVEYDGKKIHSRADLQQARADAASKDSVLVLVQRGEAEIGFKVKPGPLGFVPRMDFGEPVFK